ncbi:hypothetical protein HYDPIDRAFT_117845 [Hydnomerulius pinastri MD-312]|uniref:G domain-containing protein n=1 Tax=Hydnomerulius pinastri MD-312 TaxID=994086 RepID=A0A0C9WA38_9AGAM|nr:hypothetical protein HYDPIDRAFT_117845 [Hydnomerulius pinastri MD-312]
MGKDKVYVVVVFGRTGMGISSLVNLIVGKEGAKCSREGRSCTKDTKAFRLDLDGRKIDVYDTPGFGGTDNKPSDNDIISKILRISKKHGIDLLINCLVPKDGIVPGHYNAVLSALRGQNREAPIAAVVTRLERVEGPMEGWWSEPSNNGGKMESKWNMVFAGHACVTTVPSDDIGWSQRRSESQKAVRALVLKFCH